MQHSSTTLKQTVTTEPVHILATVLSIGKNNDYIVECDNGYSWHCQLAASCLLKPEPKDYVLVSGPTEQQVFIIAVITKHATNVSNIEIAGTLAINATNIQINSQTDLQLQMQNKLIVDAEQLQLNSQKGTCMVDDMQYIGDKVTTTVNIFRHIGNLYEMLVDRLSQISKFSFKTTQEVEQIRAGMIDYEASSTARIHSQYNMITADELTKVDSKQIHMG